MSRPPHGWAHEPYPPRQETCYESAGASVGDPATAPAGSAYGYGYGLPGLGGFAPTTPHAQGQIPPGSYTSPPAYSTQGHPSSDAFYSSSQSAHRPSYAAVSPAGVSSHYGGDCVRPPPEQQYAVPVSMQARTHSFDYQLSTEQTPSHHTHESPTWQPPGPPEYRSLAQSSLPQPGPRKMNITNLLSDSAPSHTDPRSRAQPPPAISPYAAHQNASVQHKSVPAVSMTSSQAPLQHYQPGYDQHPSEQPQPQPPQPPPLSPRLRSSAGTISSSGRVMLASEYRTWVRQHPVAARSCGYGERDRRVIDPPPIVQLAIDDPNATPEQISMRLRFPFAVMHCSIWDETGQVDCSAMPDDYRQQRRLMGTLVSSPFVGRDENGEEGCFFCFPDLSCRTPGPFRLKFSLVVLDPQRMLAGGSAPVVSTTMSAVFSVYNVKDFPGMQASTALTKRLKEQGCLISIKKGNEKTSAAHSREESLDDEEDDDDDDDEASIPPSLRKHFKRAKRM